MKRIPITILIVTLFAVTAIAAPRGHERARGEILPPPLLAELLELTDAQIAQVKPLRETLHTTIEPLREQQRTNQEQIRDAVESGNAAQAGELMIANYNLAQQIKAAQDTFKTSFEALLTGAQKAKWDVYQEIVELRRSPRE